MKTRNEREAEFKAKIAELDALLNSKISYPTWEEMSKKLAVQYVDPDKDFGHRP